MDNTTETLATLALLAVSSDRVRIAFDMSNGSSDKLEKVYSAIDAAEYVKAMSATAEMIGFGVRFTIYRVEA